MSEVKVNKISPRTNCGTVTLGDSGDTFTIPAGVSITNSGTASGFGSTGEVSWVTTKKTATFTATAGEGYFCDTSSGAFTVNLPAGTAGNSFAVADYTNTFQTNGLTISPNGSQKIGGVNADVVLSTEGQSAYFVYVDDTEGWKNVIDSTSNLTGNAFLTASGGTETTCGNFKIHTFTGPGTFTVSALAVCTANNDVDYLVVAGGGGGASNYGGGGGGGFRYFANTTNNPQSGNPGSPLNGYGSPTPSGTKITATATGYPITVGGGGNGGGFSPGQNGSRGVSSVFSTVTSTGGGGASNACGVAPEGPGGSGGGGGNTGSPVTNGTGNTPPVTPSQGNPGGNGLNVPGVCNTGGGGGGAIATGSAGASPYRGGNGGAGAGVTGFGAGNGECSSCKQYFSGGGGASSQPGRGSPYSVGGLGGGGDGKYACLPSPTTKGQNGTDNTGGGGGGGITPSSPSPGAGNGGSGIVVIRYKYQ